MPIFAKKTIRKPERLKRRCFLTFLTAVIVMPLTLLSYAFFMEPRRIRIIKYKIHSGNLPAEFNGTKIVFITDTHHNLPYSADLREQLLQLVEKNKPDLVLFGGDYASENDRSVKQFFDSCSKISAKLGMFGVLGNHDYWNPHKVSLAMEAAGIKNLTNAATWIMKGSSRIKIAGVGDLWRGKQNLTPMKEGLKSDDFVILLTHNPDYIDQLSEKERKMIDLVFAGHSHGGQVTVFGVYAPVATTLEKYRTGLITPWPNEKIRVIVSNGIGTVGIPVRFCAPPQLVIVELSR
ncbi:MAG: metallophosphoesterase [Planctomycetaceae bacterium]|nr:metallophosphoesterase [Planctomycetaceae bacterium]